MTDLIPIRRELLERLANEFETETEWNCANVPAGTRAATTRAIAMKSMADELRAILAAPRQPEGEGLREDAERYRYLRNTAEWPEAVDYAVECGSPGQMDVAIDAAIAAARKGEGE